jgi:hypothetical protein
MSGLSCVYWIHLESHSNISKEGYIGVTSKEPEERLKHGDKVIVTTLLKGLDDYCYLIEQRLRPSERIGWNTVPGGGKPPVKNTPHTAEAKKKISEASRRTSQSPAKLAHYASRVGKKRSEETLAKITKKAQGRLPWKTSRANKVIWLNADKFFEVFKETGMKAMSMEKLLDLKPSTLGALYKKFIAKNWNPKTDPLWLGWVYLQNINKGSI